MGKSIQHTGKNLLTDYGHKARGGGGVARVVSQSLLHTPTVQGRYMPTPLITSILTILNHKNKSNL